MSSALFPSYLGGPKFYDELCDCPGFINLTPCMLKSTTGVTVHSRGAPLKLRCES
jgi:hypothetical protein